MDNLILPDAASISPIITCTILNIIDEDDIRSFAEGLVAGAPAPAEVDDPHNVQRLREKHHSLARLIASGMTQRLAASISGYTESYVSILLNAPAMRELVDFYRMKQGHAAEVITENLRTVGTKALTALSERLDDAEAVKKMNTFELAAAAKLGLDRAGHGPTSKHEVLSETHVIDHAEIQRLNAEARKGSSSYIVPVQTVRAAALPAPEAEGGAEGSTSE